MGCVSGMLEDMLQQALKSATEFLPAKEKKRLSGISIGNLFSLSWEKEGVSRANWRTQIEAILDALAKHGIGLLFTIDEVNPHLKEIISFASTYQLMLRENRKVALLMAGLPSMVSSLLNDRSVSFLRRASRYDLERIDDYEIEDAFRKTVEGFGKKIEPTALKKAVKAISGSPYMMQLVGFRSWQQAGEKKELSARAITEGISLAKKDFESRVLKSTIEELSNGDKAFLRAMLTDDDVVEINAIEKQLKKSSGYVSRYRARLIERGVIEPSGRGQVTFALPGLKEYLKRDI